MTTGNFQLGALLVWLGLLLASPPRADGAPPETDQARAAAPLWQIEAEHSGCDFSLHALRWFKVSGRFSRIEGAVWPGPDGHLASIRVPMSSVVMASSARRDWALSSEFFDAAQFPELRFDARLDRIDRESLRRPIHGSMQLRGIRAAVTFRVAEVDCDTGNTRCRITANSAVSRRRFGMTSQRLLLGDTVKLQLHLELSRVGPAATDDRR